MKTIFIITWCIISHVPTSCPDAPKKDEYGRLSNPYMSCAVNHVKRIESCDNRRYFYSYDSAKAFYESAKKQSDLSKVQLDTL